MTPTKKLIVGALLAWPFAIVAVLLLTILYRWGVALLAGDGPAIVAAVVLSAFLSIAVAVRLINRWS